ncbi:hypothetical protein ACIQYS_05880 [Psychrobacillus sp. NPDC096426]
MITRKVAEMGENVARMECNVARTREDVVSRGNIITPIRGVVQIRGNDTS